MKTKRTVALLHYTSWPSIGGVETILRQQSELLAADGFTVQLLVGAGAAFSNLIEMCAMAELNGPDPAVAAAQQEALKGRPGPAFRAVRELLRRRLEPIFSECSSIIVHNYFTMPFNLAATHVLSDFAREGFPIVAWTHDLAALNADYVVPRNPVCDLLRQKLPGVVYVAISELRAREFEILTGKAPDLVIPNGVDLARLAGLPPELEKRLDAIWGETLILFYPTRIVPRKNIELAIKIVADLIKQGQSTRLIISGAANIISPPNQPYLRELKSLADECGLARQVIWANEYCVVDDQCLRALYLASDALLFTSRQEGFGLPLTEAPFLRLPVFCSDIEPLRTIAGGSATVFDLNASPENIAKMIRGTLDRDELFTKRRKLLRQYSARQLYSDRLKPLLYSKR